MRDPRGKNEPSFIKDVGRGLVREFGNSLRWALAGSLLGAGALGAAGFWYFGWIGLLIGAAVGAVVGGAALWFFYVDV